MESACYVELQPTEESRSRGASRATEPAFLGKNTRNLHITWTWNLLTKAEPGAAVARPNLRFWAKPHGICILRGFWGLFKNAVENRTKNLQNFWGAGMPLWYYREEGSAG